jgi:hypothetical protein
VAKHLLDGGDDVSGMKLLMSLGGLIGFGLGALAGWLQGCAWPEVFWRACVAAVLAGIVLRWWGRVWIKSLEAAVQERAGQPNSSSTALSSTEPSAPGHAKA